MCVDTESTIIWASTGKLNERNGPGIAGVSARASSGRLKERNGSGLAGVPATVIQVSSRKLKEGNGCGIAESMGEPSLTRRMKKKPQPASLQNQI